MPPPSPTKVSSHIVSPERTWVPLSWNPEATKWVEVGWEARNVGWSTARPVVRAAKLLTRPPWVEW